MTQEQTEETKLLELLKDLMNKVKSNEVKLDEALERIDLLSNNKPKTDLTRREDELLNIMLEMGKGLTIAELSERRDISYSTSYKLLSSLEEKGYLKRVVKSKGNLITFELVD